MANEQTVPATADHDVTNSGVNEDAMLADIIRNSDIMNHDQSLNEAEVPHPADSTEEQDLEEVEETAVSEDETDEEETDEEVIEEAEDDTSTQEAPVYALDELDDFKIKHKIDGEEVVLSIEELVKGYATDQSLSKKGRELGDARKALDEEREKKIGEIDTVLNSASAILMKAETKLSEEYHGFDTKIQEARDSGDTYAISDLKDQKDQVQDKYWAARKEREAMQSEAVKQKNTLEQETWNKKLEGFSNKITKLIPDWNDDLATEIRTFAIDRGIPEAMINTMVDADTIKFVDDFRRAEKARTKGTVKRKAVVKATPLKKGTPANKKADIANANRRTKVLSGDASKAEQDAFLKNMVSRHNF